MQSIQPKLLYFSVISLLIFLFNFDRWYLAASILFLCIPLIINVFKFFSLKDAQLSITRDVQSISDVDNIITVTLTIINTGAKLDWVEIEDIVNTDLLDEGESNKWLYAFKHNEKKTLTYKIKTQRGIHHFEGIKVTSHDWLGITSSIKTLNICSTIQVNPTLELKDRIDIKSKLLHGFSGLINSKRAGPGVDFFGLREYNNQDSVKHIHWRASAKLQDGFLVKQNLITKNTTAVIYVDTRFHLLPKDDSSRTLEYSLKAARLISDVLMDDSHKVGLIAEQKEHNIILPAQNSNMQKLRINQSLSSITEHKGIGIRSLVNMPQMFLKNHSSLFIISPLEKGDTLYLLNLKRRGFNVICIAPDYTQLIAPLITNNQTDSLNAKHAQLKQQLLVDGLLQKGIIVISWDISQPFSVCARQINLYSRLINETKYSL